MEENSHLIQAKQQWKAEEKEKDRKIMEEYKQVLNARDEERHMEAKNRKKRYLSQTSSPTLKSPVKEVRPPPTKEDFISNEKRYKKQQRHNKLEQMYKQRDLNAFLASQVEEKWRKRRQESMENQQFADMEMALVRKSQQPHIQRENEHKQSEKDNLVYV